MAGSPLAASPQLAAGRAALPNDSAFASLEEAYCLDTYFNLARHPALGYRFPHQFEADLLQHLPQLTVRSG